LLNAGHRVESALSAEEGIELLKTYVPEIILSDVLLPGIDGIEAVRHIHTQAPTAHCILMTDWATADRKQAELTALDRAHVTLLFKPLLPDELLQAMDAAVGDSLSPGNGRVRRDRERAIVVSSLAPAERTRIPRAVQNSLRNLRRQTRATQVVLFALDDQRRQVRVVAHEGGLLHQNAVSELIHSPVRDVAEDRMTVQIEDVERSAAYVRYLAPLLDFGSCVGAPVPGNLLQRYALFIFHRDAGFTGATVTRDAQATATVVGTLLEQEAFLQRAAEMQNAMLLGNLSHALVHETNHRLNPIVFALSDLERQCGLVQQMLHDGSPQPTAEMQMVQSTLRQLNDHVQQLIDTTRLFGRITVQDETTMVRVDQVVEECIELVRDTAERARVRVQLEAPHHILFTRIRQSQIQQVLLNLLLNAIQQISLSRPQSGGAIHIRLDVVRAREHPGRDGESSIRIVIEDDGPGIHRRLWNRVFDLGFTTRQGEGSGLGLFLSQRLLEAAGGAVRIQSSSMLWGTRMAVDLPIHFT
jgi:signal transduction histidine kinase